jgi:hypothetical protein
LISERSCSPLLPSALMTSSRFDFYGADDRVLAGKRKPFRCLVCAAFRQVP